MGGTGFLGSHLARILGPGNEVIVAGRTPAAAIPGTRFVAGDRRDPRFIGKLMSLAPDLWFDLALFAPEEAEMLVAAWRKAPHPTTVTVAGTVAEFGLARKPEIPVSENAVLEPEGSYGRGKAEAWRVAARAHVRHGFPVVWAVLPQLWGPQDPHARDSAYVQAMVNGRAILLRGNGRTLMPDGFVGTAAAAIAHLASNPKHAGHRYNVAGQHALTPLAFIREAARALGAPARVRHVPHRAWEEALQLTGENMRPVFGDYDFILDLEKLQRTGFRQRVGWAEGVALTAAWHAAGGSTAAPPFTMPHSMLEHRFVGAVDNLYCT